MKILVVEDDKIVSDNLTQLLELEGYEVNVATDGVEALQMIVDIKPALIITDIKMPNLTGLELLNIYRGHLFEEIPVIVISSMESYDVQYFAIAAGAVAYFVKPYSGDEVVETINELLANTTERN